MKYIFIITTTLFLISCTYGEEKQLEKQEMSKEDVDKWFKEYMALDKEEKKLDKKLKELEVEEKNIDKLNNTLDELTNMVEVKNKN